MSLTQIALLGIFLGFVFLAAGLLMDIPALKSADTKRRKTRPVAPRRKAA